MGREPELSSFRDFAATDAGRTDAKVLSGSIQLHVNLLEVYVPAPLCHIVGMADAVAEPGASIAHFTYLRHWGETPAGTYTSVSLA